jgi:hypothetical protein
MSVALHGLAYLLLAISLWPDSFIAFGVPYGSHSESCLGLFVLSFCSFSQSLCCAKA